ETKKLLDSKKNYKMMSKAKNPYGDGKASERIVKVLEKHL
ncbi:MAG: UDP-N-acetylglucosamine 2-epimerase, partial [Candidatus Aureabacteria bacterium]|nr:UDP-N-acetylglucosamine 2-epimerase [Candidatus Auribacterota bacterium]MCK5161862.1 UDP-N-acetylglucosamine 2-epimerase [Candidatus Auribacterota bacterium]